MFLTEALDKKCEHCGSFLSLLNYCLRSPKQIYTAFPDIKVKNHCLDVSLSCSCRRVYVRNSVYESVKAFNTTAPFFGCIEDADAYCAENNILDRLGKPLDLDLTNRQICNLNGDILEPVYDSQERHLFIPRRFSKFLFLILFGGEKIVAVQYKLRIFDSKITHFRHQSLLFEV